MTIQGSSTVQLLQSAMDARKTREDMSVAVLDKAQNLMKQQGDAMVRLLEDTGKVATKGHFEALA